MHHSSNVAPPRTARIVIVGAGFAGLGAAIRLKQEGVDDFVVLERADELGGTWRANTYPGCACDVPSHLYSYSFAPNPRWSKVFAGWAEIKQYLVDCAERFAVTPHIRSGCEVRGARWDDARERWALETSEGPVEASIMIAAAGPLTEPQVPKFPGLERFAGRAFHSARWDHDFDLRGKRVAVIGTGASAIQFIPEIQPEVERLYVFQRTAPWIGPRRDLRISGAEQQLMTLVPPIQRGVRTGMYWLAELGAIAMTRRPELLRGVEALFKLHLRRQVRDPQLRAKLTPDFTIGCKRILGSDAYYPALQKPNAELVTEPVKRVRKGAIVTEDDVVRDVDAIIFGTGFHVTDQPIARLVVGRDGRSLDEVWEGSPRAYLGMTAAGFPNAFTLVGPNTGLGHNSIVFMIEAQLNYVIGALRAMDSEGLSSIEVLPEVEEAFVEEVQARMPATVWASGGCESWYMDANGRISTLWPDFTWRYWLRTRRFDLDSYRGRLDLTAVAA